uniref:Uncharacterized protein n=1 Tax=Anopheles minimus TaxID=112268 RepID=A0A182WNZ7_9DIPT
MLACACCHLLRNVASALEWKRVTSAKTSKS